MPSATVGDKCCCCDCTERLLPLLLLAPAVVAATAAFVVVIDSLLPPPEATEARGAAEENPAAAAADERGRASVGEAAPVGRRSVLLIPSLLMAFSATPRFISMTIGSAAASVRGSAAAVGADIAPNRHHCCAPVAAQTARNVWRAPPTDSASIANASKPSTSAGLSIGGGIGGAAR